MIDKTRARSALFLALVVLVWLTRPRRGVASDVPGGAH